MVAAGREVVPAAEKKAEVRTEAAWMAALEVVAGKEVEPRGLVTVAVVGSVAERTEADWAAVLAASMMVAAGASTAMAMAAAVQMAAEELAAVVMDMAV